MDLTSWTDLFSRVAFPAAVAGVLLWWMITRLEVRLDRLAEALDRLGESMTQLAERVDILSAPLMARPARRRHAREQREE